MVGLASLYKNVVRDNKTMVKLLVTILPMNF